MSTIFADKFKNTSGGNPVQINQLRGIDTAGSITIQGEGTATTNLQQGLVKVWVDVVTASSFGDSFNMASMTDHGSSDQQYFYSSIFANGASVQKISMPNQNITFFGNKPFFGKFIISNYLFN